MRPFENEILCAIEVLLDEMPGFEASWIELGMEKRLEILEIMEYRMGEGNA